MKQTSNKDGEKFVAALTVALIVASLWIFSAYLSYLLVAAVLALATSHGYNALAGAIQNSRLPESVKKYEQAIAATVFTLIFLMMIFVPLLYFTAELYDQVTRLDIAHVKQTILDMGHKALAFLDGIPVLRDILDNWKAKGDSLITGATVEAGLGVVQKVAVSAGGLFGQVVWILVFFFLFNLYGKQILNFCATVMPTSLDQEKYLYRECAGTVSVVFYGTLFNMFAQGLAFGVLMAFIGGYNALSLGVLAGFCSIIPIIGTAIVYIPLAALELFAGHWLNAAVIVGFSWVVMGFFIDNILRLIFINRLKKAFGFEYMMNDILILLSILAGIASFGFWGIIIGPSVIALTLAAANLYSSRAETQDDHQ